MMLACKLIGKTLALRTRAPLLVIPELPSSQKALSTAEDTDKEEAEVPLVWKRQAPEVDQRLDPDRATSRAAAGPSGQGEEMESTMDPDLRTAFQAKKSGTGPVVKRPRVAKKATPTMGNTSKSPAKGKSVLSQYRSITHDRARNEELQAELDAAKVALNAAQEGEQAAKAALTAAQKNEHATKAALTSSQESEQVAKTALSTSQAQIVEANHLAELLQVEIGELKAKLLEVEVKAKEEKAVSSSVMEKMLYHC
ncbi:uncharacterized protein LOC133791890 [Humulus lupulus]|uniref:uncharacterized protein LOC133791890 n=1 Tax=Humulus lupulus TaxID=3486 RepID=UPI002B405332|nr:uncharacterized protein LOC133791890 [Humulus lupulus]